MYTHCMHRVGLCSLPFSGFVSCPWTAIIGFTSHQGYQAEKQLLVIMDQRIEVGTLDNGTGNRFSDV